MEFRRLGIGGPTLSVIGLGCNNFGMKLSADEGVAVVRAALEAGITHFDTAEMYGGGLSEQVLGLALGAHRPNVTIATKFSPLHSETFRPGDLARRIVEACEGSLRRLSTDYIDLYYQHYTDPRAQIDEVLEALAALVAAGKIRHVAVSNAEADYLLRSEQVAAEVSWCGLQTQWSLLARDAENSAVPMARACGLGVVPYFPLASGLLTGKYSSGKPYPGGSRLATFGWAGREATDENLAKVARLDEFARSRGRSLLELALGWLLSHDEVTSVIAGATSAEQVRLNVAGSTWRLGREDMSAISAVLGPMSSDQSA